MESSCCLATSPTNTTGSVNSAKGPVHPLRCYLVFLWLEKIFPRRLSLSFQHHIWHHDSHVSAECPDTDYDLSSGLICRSFSDWWKHQRHVTTSDSWQSRLGSPQWKLRGRRWLLVLDLLSDRSYQISSMLETVSWKTYERIPSYLEFYPFLGQRWDIVLSLMNQWDWGITFYLINSFSKNVRNVEVEVEVNLLFHRLLAVYFFTVAFL